MLLCNSLGVRRAPLWYHVIRCGFSVVTYESHHYHPNWFGTTLHHISHENTERDAYNVQSHARNIGMVYCLLVYINAYSSIVERVLEGVI